jgi:hypothetical protein
VLARVRDLDERCARSVWTTFRSVACISAAGVAETSHQNQRFDVIAATTIVSVVERADRSRV